ncbi:hypothetical protein MC7420_2361 [Coleofasciculus chthonoplastes PCC 7420]|uniref:Uncharacterized protein n=1 Tax=Coleofasciculus chthonoplastes PCC 7420 TaxID=118168 RepID=B4W2B6_9CYAN|nr:hypothetical protein MC7420_2361 [Coleofasciculus chthonoplastes PCC 7420]
MPSEAIAYSRLIYRVRLHQGENRVVRCDRMIAPVICSVEC